MLRPLRPRRRRLQPARARRPVRQVRARRRRRPKARAPARNDMRILQTEFRAESLALAQKVVEHARSRGLTPLQFALGWVWNNALVHGVIGGPRTLAQWQEYVARAGASVRRRRRGAGRFAGRARARVDARATPIRTTRSRAAGHAIAEAALVQGAGDGSGLASFTARSELREVSAAGEAETSVVLVGDRPRDRGCRAMRASDEPGPSAGSFSDQRRSRRRPGSR